MTASLRRAVREIGNDCHWALYGPAGVVDWSLRNVQKHSTEYGFICIHSPRPQFPEYPDMNECPLDDCAFLEMPCYFDCAGVAGDALGRRWDASGRDDEVIWAELESWYADRLAGLAVAK